MAGLPNLPRIPYPDAARGLLRSTVLAAVDELVRSDGWAATSVAALARAAGVSRQTIYNEFGNRRSIAEAYIIARLDELLDAAETLLREGGDLEGAMRICLARFLDLVDTPLIQVALAADNDEVIGLVKITNERATKRLAQLFRSVEPSIGERDAIVFADALARVAVGHAVAPTLPRDEAIDRMIRLTLALVRATPAQTPREVPKTGAPQAG